MGYTNRNIVASTLETGQTPSAANWRAHFLELHDAIIASGWVQSGDTGQLDIAAVLSTPAKDTYPGFRIYEIDDDLSAVGYKIYMKLEFGSYSEVTETNFHNGATPSIKLSFGMTTDGAGGLLSQTGGALAPVATYRNPQSASGSGNSASFVRPTSYQYCCKNDARGFFGLVFYCNGRGKFGNATYQYNASSLSVFVQRTLDESGAPSNEGFTIYTTNSVTGSSRWPSSFSANNTLNSTVGFSYGNNVIHKTLYGQVRPGGIDAAPDSGEVQVGPCYSYSDAKLKFNPNLVTYRSLDLTEGTQFLVEVAPGDVRNFIALGPGTGMNPDVHGNQNSFAMLFE